MGWLAGWGGGGKVGLARAVYHSLASPVGLRVTCTSPKVRHLPTTPTPSQDFFWKALGDSENFSKAPRQLLDFLGRGLGAIAGPLWKLFGKGTCFSFLALACCLCHDGVQSLCSPTLWWILEKSSGGLHQQFVPGLSHSRQSIETTSVWDWHSSFHGIGILLWNAHLSTIHATPFLNSSF